MACRGSGFGVHGEVLGLEDLGEGELVVSLRLVEAVDERQVSFLQEDLLEISSDPNFGMVQILFRLSLFELGVHERPDPGLARWLK